MTPGPWRYAYDGSGSHNIFDAKNERVAGCLATMDKPCDEARRNAMLIAKVPEMVDLIDRLAWSGDVGGKCACVWCEGLFPVHAPDCRLHAILKLAEDASNGQ